MIANSNDHTDVLFQNSRLYVIFGNRILSRLFLRGVCKYILLFRMLALLNHCYHIYTEFGDDFNRSNTRKSSSAGFIWRSYNHFPLLQKFGLNSCDLCGGKLCSHMFCLRDDLLCRYNFVYPQFYFIMCLEYFLYKSTQNSSPSSIGSLSTAFRRRLCCGK